MVAAARRSTVLAGLLAAGMAWREGGSILAADWLPYAIAARAARRRRARGGARGHAVAARPSLALGGGSAARRCGRRSSAVWSPLPAAARDEALLVGDVRPRAGGAARDAARAPCANAGRPRRSSPIAARARGGRRRSSSPGARTPGDRFDVGRLYFPIDYVNAQGAAFLLALLARGRARRPARPAAVVRALARRRRDGACSRPGSSRRARAAASRSPPRPSSCSPSRPRGCGSLVPARDRRRARRRSRTGRSPTRSATATTTGPLVDAAHAAGARILVLTVVGAARAGAPTRSSTSGSRSRRDARRLIGRIAAAALVVCVRRPASPRSSSRVDHPGRLGRRPLARLQDAADDRDGVSHFARPRLEPLRLLARRARRVRATTRSPGIGARGWDVAYLQHGRSDETPRRAHSLELDALSEDGIVGLALLALALGPLLVVARAGARAATWLGAGRSARAPTSPSTRPATGSGRSRPSGSPFFLLAGIGRSPRRPAGAARPRGADRWRGRGGGRRGARVRAASGSRRRITADALEHPGADPHADLRWARRLDPLSTDPLVAESQLAQTPAAAIPPLASAVRQRAALGGGCATCSATPTARRPPGRGRAARAAEAARASPRATR